MKGFLIRLPILSAIAVIAAAVMGTFGLLSIPLALAGFIVGWGLRWVLFNIMHATANSLPDKLLKILLPFIGALFGAFGGGAV
jgi:divalent metal cation (Fe/Co/Zn/Cd) transporter